MFGHIPERIYIYVYRLKKLKSYNLRIILR